MMSDEEEVGGAYLEQFQQVSFEQFFKHPVKLENTKFFIENKILRNPDKILSFFKQFDNYSLHSQTALLDQILDCLNSITTNGKLLASAKDPISGKQLVYFLLDRILKAKTSRTRQLLQSVLHLILRYHQLHDKLIKQTLKQLVIDFYDNKVETDKLLTTAQITQSIYQNKVQNINQPNNPIIFHGETDNLIESERNIGWVFGKGFTFAAWIWFEPIISKSNQPLGKVFTFYAEGVGGLETHIGPRYSQPSQMVSGTYMCSIQPHKWHFFAVEHQQPKTFSKSKVNVYLDKKLVNSISLDPPKPNPTCPTKIRFFNNFYGQTSPFCLYFNPVGTGRIDQLSRNVNSIQYLKDPKVLIFQQKYGKLVQRSGFGWMQIQLFHKNRKIQSQHMLPFFYYLRFIQADSIKPLNQLLALIISFLVLSQQHQQDAYKSNFFQMLGVLICDLNYDPSDDNTIKILNTIKQSITDQKLLDKFFSQLLWKLLDSKISIDRKIQVLSIIKTCFTQNLTHFSQVLGLDNILNFLVKHETRKCVCCEIHQQAVGSLDRPFVESKQQKFLLYILQLLELLFVSPKIDMNVELIKLMRLSVVKFSPCFQLGLIHLIRKIFTDKLSDRTAQDSFKKTLKTLFKNNIHLLFLQLIADSQFIDIKAETLKLLFYLISFKIFPLNQEEIAAYVSQQRFFKITPKKQISFPTSSIKQITPLEVPSPTKSFNLFPTNSPQSTGQQTMKQAPGMRNSRKPGGRRFQFPTIIESVPQTLILQTNQIQEEQKTSQPQNVIVQLPTLPQRKPFRLNLQINTEQINKYFDQAEFPTQIDQDGERQEIQRIRQLTLKCLRVMNNELYNQTVEIERRPAPQTSRQKKSFTFPIGVPMAPLHSTRHRDIQGRKKNFQDIRIPEQKQSQPSASKKSSGVLSIQQRTTPKILLYEKKQKQNLILLYTSMIEMVFQRNINKLTTPPPKIQSINCLYILLTWTLQATKQIKQLVLADLSTIIQSPVNLTILAESEQVLKFLMKMIQEALDTNNTNLLSDSHELLKKISTQIFFKDPHCDEKLLFIVNWPSKVHARYVWKILMNAIEQYCSLFAGNDNIRQKNFCNLCLMTQQLIYYGNDRRQPGLNYIRQNDLPNLMKQIFSSNNSWIDEVIAQQLIRIFNKYFVSQAYHDRKKNISHPQNDEKFIQSVLKRGNDYIKETLYFLGQKGSRGALLSLINIYSSYVEYINQQDSAPIQTVEQLIALVKLLLVLPEILTPKQYNEKRNQIIQVLGYSIKVLIQELRGAAGRQIFNFIVNLKSIMKLQLNQIGTQTGPIFLNNLIGEFLQKYFSSNSHIFQKNLFQQYSNQLRLITESFSESFPIQRLFDDDRVTSRIISLDQKIKLKYQEDTYEFVTSTIQDQKNRQHHISILEEVYQRKFKKQFKSVWKQLRLFDGLWAHPDFYFQNDQLFSKVSVSYQKMSNNFLYDVRVSKHESKNRARVFLQPKLKQPNLVAGKVQNQKQGRQKLSTGIEGTYKLVTKADDDQRFSLNQSLLEMILPWKSSQTEIRRVQLVNTLTLRQGLITITNERILFMSLYYEQKKSHLCMVNRKIGLEDSIVKQWPLEYVKQVQRRRFLNQRTAIQIFFITGKSIFLNFTQGDADQFSKKLIRQRKGKCPNLVYHKSLDPKKIIEQSLLAKRWSHYQISNFDYLMQLNSLSGRTFRDISQYPVFPWLITSFAQKLDIGSAGSYRDLRKNVGSLGSQNRIQNFKQRYEGLALSQQPFHFGTHYSSPGIIFHYLVRLPPYTQGLILLQSGHFDFADRMFYSIQDSYRNCTTQQSDVRQLVPEFFTLPEMFLNLNHYDFGTMQNQKRVHNVQLPLWAKDNPYFYVSRLRKALQSTYTNHNLQYWIDIIFGNKQKGQQAMKNLNVFLNVTYQDAVDFSHLNKSQKLSLETQILNYGQTPSQIFFKSHIQRSELSNNILIFTDDIETKVYRPPQKKNQSLRLEVNPMMFNSKAIIKLKQIKDHSKDSKLICIRKNGDVTNYKWSSQSQTQVPPFQCCIEGQRKFVRINKLKFDPNQFYDRNLNPETFPIEVIKQGELVFLGGLNQGKLLAISSDDMNSQTQIYRAHHYTISVLKCDSKDKFLVSGDMSGDVILWRISNNGKLLLSQKYSDHADSITSIFISQQLRVFATSSADGSVHLYNIITKNKIRSYFHPERKPINNVTISTSPLAAVILFCGIDRMILSYSINGQLLKKVTQKYSNIFVPSIIKYQKGLEYLVYGSQKGEVVVRDIPFLDNPKVFAVAKDAAVTGISISKDYRFLICCCSDGELSVIVPAFHERNKTT